MTINHFLILLFGIGVNSGLLFVEDMAQAPLCLGGFSLHTFPHNDTIVS